MNYIALDVGSSFIKVAMIDLDKKAILDERLEPQLLKLQTSKGFYEVDADELYNKVKSIIDSYAKDRTIAGILLSTQMHGFILARDDSTPITPYISWRDERCLQTMPGTDQTYLDYLKTVFSREDMKYVGAYIKPYMALCNLFTMIQQGFVIRQGMHFCTLGSYLIYRLTGNNICHITNASPTGFANIKENAWDQTIIQRAQCDGLVFPEITSDFISCGKYKGMDVYPDLGDHQCCVLGIMAKPQSDLIVNIGTAGQLSYIVNQFIWGEHESRPFFDGRYLNTLSQMPGGRNFDTIIHLFMDVISRYGDDSVTSEVIWKRLIHPVDSVDTDGLVVDTSFYTSLDRSNGYIQGITAKNLNVNSLVYACFQNVADIYAEHTRKISRSFHDFDRILFAGGLLEKIPLLCKMLSDSIGLPGVLPPHHSDVFYGLYRVAMVCSGERPDIYSTLEP